MSAITFEIHHNLISNFKAIKTYPSSLDVMSLKEKLSVLTGSSTAMSLFVDSQFGTIPLNDEHKTLQEYGIPESATLRVVDNDPFSIVKQINSEQVCII